jgi:hypothetical protein
MNDEAKRRWIVALIEGAKRMGEVAQFFGLASMLPSKAPEDLERAEGPAS